VAETEVWHWADARGTFAEKRPMRVKVGLGYNVARCA
jgi:hypothetical protein